MTGGVLLTNLEWISVTNKGVTNLITDWVSMTAHKSTEIKNNILKITLKNSPINYDGTNIYGTHVTSGYDLVFNEEDQFNLYLKLTSDADDIGVTTWATDSYLIGQFVLSEYTTKTLTNNAQITLKCVDRAFLLFNKVATGSYGVTGEYTSPGIFRKLCRDNSESISSTITSFTGTNHDVGVDYSLSSRFVSEGGYIKDYRTTSDGGPDTELDGGINDSDTTIAVDSTAGFKSSGTIVVSDGTDTEHISYTGVTATTFTGCTRAIDDTKAISHSNNTSVWQGFPSIMLTKS